MSARRAPSPAKVRLARIVFGLGWLAAAAVLLAGPAYRRGYIDFTGIQIMFGGGASLALAAVIGGLALALLLPAHDQRTTILATRLGWLFRLVVIGVFGIILAFVAARVVSDVGALTDSRRLLGLAGAGVLLAVVLGFLWAIAQPAGAARPGLLSTLMGIGMGAIAAWAPINWRITAETVPRINDISTDTAQPPPFVALSTQRADAGSGGLPSAAVAAAQRAGYPDIRPVTLKTSPSDVFARVERLARSLDWDIAAAVPAQGRLEAVVTSSWFGFKDDVVVRLTPVAGGTRVDVRSRSRVGISDLGVNAARIRMFLARLQQPD